MKPTQYLTLPCYLAGGLLLAQSLHAQIVFTAENPGVQSTTVAGATTETFDEPGLTAGTALASPYVTPIGTFTGGGEVVAANLYGGAGGTGNYFAVGSESGTTSATLTFNGPQNYFGLWWSAGDINNVLKFYDGTTLEATFNVGSIIPSLTSAYYGNPNSDFLDQDPNEPFEYLDFTDLGGGQFTSVQFDNTTSTGFEMDNLSVASGVITPPGHPVGVPDATSTSLLFLISLATLIGYRQRRSCQWENRTS